MLQTSLFKVNQIIDRFSRSVNCFCVLAGLHGVIKAISYLLNKSLSNIFDYNCSTKIQYPSRSERLIEVIHINDNDD